MSQPNFGLFSQSLVTVRVQIKLFSLVGIQQKHMKKVQQVHPENVDRLVCLGGLGPEDLKVIQVGAIRGCQL